ncbi:MAG: acetyltransferase [Deltaproteobacteria bacterium]|nr:acetyltransferase [Deltaproteobacteria bacterium]MBW1816140.1 acetyltransferase [Deltaproteobacteria bacterium]
MSRPKYRDTQTTERREGIRSVVLFGNGAVATTLCILLTYDSDYDVVGFTVDRPYMTADRLLDLPVMPFDRVVSVYPPDRHAMMVAVGFTQMNRLRAERCRMAKEMGYELVSYVSSKATTWPGLVIGQNCRLADNCVVQPFAEIGDDVFLGNGVIIGHHTVIQDHCFVASGVVIAGGVTLEPYCFLGIGATIRNGVTIARECVIGAGSVILENTQEKGVYMTESAKTLNISSDQLMLR